MNGLHYALRRLYDGENDIHQQLLQLAEQHHSEHEIHHVARDLAVWSADHVQLLAEYAQKLELHLDDDAATPNRAGQAVRAAISTMWGRRPEPGLLLLHDLRELYLRASDNSLAWEMLGQVAQAERKQEVLDLTERCHPQNLRQLRWANTMIKTQTPQILASL